MPGGGHRFQWIGRPPLYWTIILVVMMGQIALSLALSFTLPRWAQSVPDASHPVQWMESGHYYYLSPSTSWYMNNDIWITFALLGILAFIMIIHRDKIERIS